VKTLPYGYQLRAGRTLIGWSQEDLAKAAGIDVTTLLRMEKAGFNPVRSRNLHEVLVALAKAGVELTERGVVFVGKPRR
jgi:transcriptional regulator with XRE-family HTH domain